MQIVSIPCNFVGDFKVGDNLVYNCNLLCALAARNDDGALHKAIVLQAGAILEAALIQVIYRAQTFNLEGVPNIAPADRLAIQAARIDKFAVAIDVMRKYAVLEGMPETIYDDLHLLRKYRNKIHIQDDLRIAAAPRDEDAAFTDALATRAIRVTVIVLRHLSTALARPPHIHAYVGNLAVPDPG